MNISTDHKYNWETDTWEIIESYFRDKKTLVKHQLESYNDFVDNKIQKIINEFSPIKSFTNYNEDLGKYLTEYQIEFGDISISKPVINDNSGEVKVMYPNDARLRDLTYSADLACDIKQKIIRYNPKNLDDKDITELPVIKNISLCKLPIMLQSKYCVLSDLTNKTRAEMGEGEYDEGGYFIVNGSEKVIVSFEKKCENKIFVFPQSKGPSSTYSHIAEITSVDYNNPAFIKLFSVKLTAKEGNFFGRTIKTQISRVRTEVPIIVLFRALGVVSDKEIIKTIVYDLDNKISKILIDNLVPSLEEASPIRTKKIALEYISKYINNVIPKNKDSQSENHKLKYTEDVLINEILPHVGRNPIKKAYYLGLMVRKLLLNYLGYINDDDRDSFINKRVETPGALLSSLFRIHFNKLAKDLKMSVDTDIRNGRINEIPIKINQKIKSSTFSTNIKYALSTGNWGLKNQPNKKGVAQVLSRLSYLSSLSHRRRIIAPIDRTGKQTGPRKLHNSQFGTVCCLTGDTKVLLADGITQEKIKNIEGKSVMTINPETLEEEPSRIYDFFKIMPDKLLEIKMKNGRKIKCTDDHPFLVNKDNKYVWIKAGELNLNDKLIVNHCVKDIKTSNNTYVINENLIPENYRKELMSMGLIGTPLSDTIMSVLARLQGIIYTDGSISKRGDYYTCKVSLGEMNDAFDYIDDLRKLGFDNNKISRDIGIINDVKNSTWGVSKDGAFAALMIALELPYGKRTEQERKPIPDWIMNGSKLIKREWLSGFQGGDGSKVSYHKNGNVLKIALGRTVQHIQDKYVDSMVNFMEQMKELYKEFNVNSKVSSKINYGDRYEVTLIFEQNKENIYNYLKNIGYRYCSQKRRNTNIIYETLKYAMVNYKEKQKIYENIKNDYKNENVTYSELGRRYKIDHRQISRIINKYDKPRCLSEINLEEYIKEHILFNGKAYSTIESINDVEPEMVYDFTTVSENHSFCANGIWVHNCVETPEGAPIGIVKNLAMMTHITLNNDPQPIIECMSELGVLSLEQVKHEEIAINVNVLVNGNWIGIHTEPEVFVSKLRNMRRSGIINIFTSIAWNIKLNQININTDAGRLCRPLYIVENNDLLITDDIIKKIKNKELSWSNLLANLDGGTGIGAIEYIDTEEADCSMIAMSYNDLKNNNPNNEAFYRYTHCEIHPSMMLGVLASNIPFCNNNQSPRNLFQAAMGKQAMGIYETNFNKRMDTISHVLHYPQKPLVNTRPSIFVNSNELPSGQNAIVAIMCHTGYNQEDSLIMNKSSIERGLFNASTYKTYKDKEKENSSTLEEEKFCKPEKFNPNGTIKTRGMKQGSYDKLDDDGFIKVGSKIEANDVIIGKVLPLKQTAPNEPKFKDASTSLKDTADGKVDWVYSYKNDGYKEAKVRIRSERVPEGGDKFACFGENCEVLTINGWEKIKNIKLTDKVAILDGDNVKYECPLKLHEYDYDGKMYELRTQQVDLTVTPNHRLWIKRRNKDHFEFMNAEDAFGKRVRHKKNINHFEPNEWIGETFTIPEYTDGNNKLRPEIVVDMNDWLTFFGIFLAEGYVSYGAVTFAAHKQRVKNALEPAIKNMGFNLAKSGEQWSIGNVQLANYMKKYSPGAINKFMPDWVWQLNKEQSRLLLSSMELGDGYTSKSNNRFYYTSSKQLADDVTRLALHAGYSTNVRVPEGRKKGTPYNFKNRNQQGITNADNYVITIIKTKTEPQMNHGHCKRQNGQSEKWVDFKGKVYCLTVRTGIFYVRENGKPVWSGNSRHGQKGTIGILYNQEDMPFTKDGIVPDIIMNPLAIPSRMTIGQLIECILGKACSLNGYEGDATPFTGVDVEDIADILEQTGFERYGTEILYNGRTGEQLKARIFIGPTFYYRLKHLVSDKWHCLKMDHEVLTDSGWKFYNQLTYDDKIATLKDDELVYEHPTELIYYPDYEGKMYRIKSQQIDLDVTINHRMLVSKCTTRKRIWGKHELIKAEELVGKCVRYKKDAEWKEEDYQFVLPGIKDGNNIEYPDKIVDMDAWLTFFGIWYAEGWTTSYPTPKSGPNCRAYRVTICQCKERVKAVIYDAFKKLGYNYCSVKDKITVSNKQLYTYMKDLSVGAPYKKLPDWVWKLSKEQCRFLIKNMMLGDGSIFKNGVHVYYTSSNDLADDMMRLCLHAGWSGNKRLHHEKGNTAGMKDGRKIVAKHDLWKIVIVRKKNNPTINHSHVKKQNAQTEEVYDYKGPVFCLQVPSETFYVRRNGVAVWTGNSRSSGPYQLLTKQPAEGRSRAGGLRTGEMEKDALLAHGAAHFLKERLFDSSDKYVFYICKDCGMIAIANTVKNIFKCTYCDNSTNFAKVFVPYAMKLLWQELMSMGIVPRMLTGSV